MGFPFDLARRYMASKKQAFISMGTFFAVLGVALGVAGLATAMSVTGGFRKEFRDKVLGVNAHVLVLKRSSYFGEYRDLMKELEHVKGVTGIAPFTINPMMVTRGDRTATGVLLKGVDPARVKDVLDLPKHMKAGSLDGLRLPGAKPPTSRRDSSPTLPGSDLVISGDLPDDDAEEEPTRDAPKEKDAGKSGGPVSPEKSGKSTEKDPFDRIPGDLLDALGAAAEEESEEAAQEEPEGGGLKLEEGAPVGSIVPEGGYGSELPDDDVLPDDINADPCAKGSAALPGIVIGKTLAEDLRAGIGDCVQVTSPTIGFSFSRDSIRAPVAKQFRVTGIFHAGFDQYDAKLVYTDLYEAQQFADAGDSVTGLEMRVSDIDEARTIARSIDKQLKNGLHYTMDWEELNHGLFTALRIQQILMSAVLALIIVVAAFTVIATLIMVVLDKKKEIAVLKAILRSFLYQGMIIGAVGGIVGLVMAVIVCKLLIVYAIPLDPKVYFISHLPVDMQPMDLLLVGVFAVVVCLLATAWPAFHAARLRPAEAFREQ
jgi:lipoprotein-releasing system permease protein